MAVIRDRITVFPPDGETVVVDIKEGGVSVGTAYAERTRPRTLTLPLTLSERTSFFLPAGGGPYEVSVKLNGTEIAGPGETPVTASRFPTEIRAAIDTSEMADVIGAGTGGSIPVPVLADAAKVVRVNAEGDGYELGSVIPEFGEYEADAVLADFVNGTDATFGVVQSSGAAPTPVGAALAFPSSGLWLWAGDLAVSGHDVPVEFFINISGALTSKHVQIPVGLPRNSAAFVFPVDLVAHPGATLTAGWGYPDAEPTAAEGGVMFTLTRLGDLPTLT